MKKLTIFTAIMCASWLFTRVCAQHMIFYANEEHDYTIKFPEDWKRIDSFNTQLTLVALAPEDTEAEDGVREHLNVAIFDAKGTSKDAFFAQYKASHEEEHSSWKFISDGEMMGKDAKVLFFSCYYSSAKTGHTHGEVVYVFRNEDKAAVLTCTSSYDELEKYKPIFDKSAQSFSFGLSFEE